MRLLHTSDWHLGRTLHNVDLLDAQRSALWQIVDLVAEPADGIPVEAVLVAGDIYDRAVPPVEAVSLFAEVLTELVRHTRVIVTGGNHDSAVRLGFGSGLFTDRVQLHTALSTVGQPVLLDGVAIYPLPYLDPDAARTVLATGDDPLPRSHESVMSAALQRVRADLAARPAGTRSVVMAHAFVVGGAVTDSERSISVGGVDHVPAALFDGFDYVALGHLHGAQQPRSASGTVLRYSGSPLRYSFSEQRHTKSVTLVDLATDGAVTLTPVPIRQPREMADLTGTFADLLDAPQFARFESAWVRVTVTDRERPERLFDRITARFPHTLQISHVPAGQLAEASGTSGHSIEPRELAADFLSYVTRVEASPAELDLFEATYAEAALIAPALGRER